MLKVMARRSQNTADKLTSSLSSPSRGLASPSRGLSSLKNSSDGPLKKPGPKGRSPRVDRTPAVVTAVADMVLASPTSGPSPSVTPISEHSTKTVPLITGQPSPMVSRMIELLSDINLTMRDVDEKLMKEFPELVAQGWTVGSTRMKVQKYPVLARTANEARAMLWREVGRSKIDAYRAISDAIEATSVDLGGTERPNHDIRLKASDRMLALMGENSTPAGAKMNITVGSGDHKIMIVTSDGTKLNDII